MHRQAVAAEQRGEAWSDWIARLFRLDEPPLIVRLPVAYRTRHAIPFLFDIVRSMLLGRTLLVVVVAIISQIMFSMQPFALSRLIDGLNAELEGRAGASVTLWVFVLFGFWVGGPFFFQLAQFINVYVYPQMRVAIKTRLFQHLMGHSPHFFQVNLPGRLAQKISQAATSSHGVLNALTIDGVQTVILMITASLLLGTLSATYGWLLAIWIAVFLGLTAYLGSFGVLLFENLHNAVSKVSGRLVDTINNWELVRGFAGSDRELDVLASALGEETARSRRARLFFVAMAVMHVTLGMVLLVWLVLSALAETRAGGMTIGEFTMVCTLSANVVMVVRLLGRRMVDFFADYGSFRDGVELILQPHAMPDRPHADALLVDRGAIRFDNVTFTYPDGTRVFDHLNLDIRPGEKVGLVGASGAGKSTIIRLLTRQFSPDSGKILVDGQDIAGVTLASLSRAIGEVGQVPNVFHRSVGDNIAYGAPGAEKDAIWRAAVAAHCDDFIKRRGDGLDTLVGERGLKLSGGERQRLAIARALLKDAPILLLDEATSSLDSEVEAAIQDSLMRLMAGRTVIAIAHRLSTIVGMDRLLVLDQGQLVEEGNYDELMAADGLFAAFWKRQMAVQRTWALEASQA